MKKFKTMFSLLSLLFACLVMISCSNLIDKTSESESENEEVTQEVLIGDEIIYGDEFSFENVYKAIFEEIETTSRSISLTRSASTEESLFEFEEDDLIEMVYFFCTTINSRITKIS